MNQLFIMNKQFIDYLFPIIVCPNDFFLFVYEYK